MEVEGHRLELPPVREHDAEAPPGPGIERGAQAGIEPATGAWVTQQIGSAKARRNMSTQLHPRMPTSPTTAGRPGFATVCARARRAPGPGCTGVDAKCTGLAGPRVTLTIGGPAGSMPAWTSPSLQTTDDSPRIRHESITGGACGTMTACPHQRAPTRRGRDEHTGGAPARHASPAQLEGLQSCSALDSVVQRGPKCSGAPSWRSLAAHEALATAGCRRAQGPF